MPKRRQKKLKAGSDNKLEARLPARQVKNLSTRKDKKVSQPTAEVAEKVEFDNEKADRDKKLFMWVGVSCVMVIFFVAWIFNLKYEFKASSKKNTKSEFNWSQTKVELDKAMTQIKQGLAEIKKIQTSASQNASSSEPKLTAEQIDLLKGKLLNEVASSTATSTKK